VASDYLKFFFFGVIFNESGDSVPASAAGLDLILVDMTMPAWEICDAIAARARLD
jgi:hypothetical protein